MPDRSKSKERLRIYHVWRQMHVRCYDPANASYKNYGGRGITVCEEWDSFAQFLSDMGPRPPGFCIDRINNDGNYEPGNCCWADRKQSNGNRRCSILVDGVPLKAHMRAAGRIGDYRMIAKRIAKGMAPHEALTAPRRVWPGEQS